MGEPSKAEVALDSEKVILKGIIESTETMIAFLDLNFNFLAVNSAYAKTSGYRIDELVGRNHFDFFPDKENQAIFERVRDTGESVKFLDKAFEFAHQPERGVTYWDWVLSAVKAENGQVIGLVLSLMETTERKKLELQLKEVVDKYSTLFNASSDGIVFINLKGEFLEINAAYCRMSGYSRQELLGMPVSLVETKSSEAVAEHLSKAVEYGTVKFESKNRRKDGGFFDVEITGTYLGRDVGKIAVVVRDITERKKAEEELREHERRLELAQRVARLGSWEYFVETDEAVWSDEMFRIFSLPHKEKGPNIAEYIKLIHPGDLKGLGERMKRLFEVGKLGDTLVFDYRILQPDGSIRYLNTIRLIIDVDTNGKAKRIVGVEQDVTERKKAEDTLRLAQAKLQEYAVDLERLVEERTVKLKDAERMAAIGQTAGMVGHDIRNPLQAIAGDCYLLDNDVASLPDDETKVSLQESVRSIQDNLQYVAKIVEDLQDYARSPSPSFKKISVEKVIEEVFVVVAIPSNLQVVIEVERGFPLVRADPSMLKRVLSNLVQNAVQAMPKGGKLTLRVEQKENYVFFNIEDTGVGISDEFKPKLFTPMLTTKAKGQGLGLAVVKRLVDAQGGTISCESEVGKGTRFIVKLPLGSG